MEYTLVIIKPDAFQRKINDSILEFIAKNEFEVVDSIGIDSEISGIEWVKNKYEKHYINKAKEPYYHDLVEFMCSGETKVILYKKKDAIVDMRKLLEFIRSENGFKAENYRRNLIHASDSHREMYREARVWNLHNNITFADVTDPKIYLEYCEAQLSANNETLNNLKKDLQDVEEKKQFHKKEMMKNEVKAKEIEETYRVIEDSYLNIIHKMNELKKIHNIT